MAWTDWVDQKVDKIVNTGVKVGDKPYYDVIPRRNPNDPADRAFSAAGQGAWSNVRGAIPEMTGQALQETGRLASRATVPFFGTPMPGREAIGGMISDAGTAIRGFGESAPPKPEFQTRAEGGIYNAAKAVTNPALAIPYLGTVTGPGMLAGSAASTALHDLSRRTLGREAAIRDLQANGPDEMATGHLPGNYPVANAALNPRPETPFPMQEGDYVHNGRIYSAGYGPRGSRNVPSNVPSNAPPNALEALPLSAYAKDLNRWDVARGLRNAGINVPEMSREEMVAALTPKAGQPGLLNAETMTDDQLRNQMDLRGLNYFKMTDDKMRAAWQPVEARNMQNRPMALFTGDVNRGGAPEGPATHQQMVNRMLSSYLRDPGKFTPKDLAYLANALKGVAEGGEIPASAEAERGLKGAQTKYYGAKAEAVPIEAEAERSKGQYYEAHGKNAPFITRPGDIAWRFNQEPGYPATEIARGKEERPGTTGAYDRMDEIDKLDYTAASKAIMDPMTSPEEKILANQRRQEIMKRYGRGPNLPSRQEAYDRLKKLGRYKEEDINVLLDEEGFK